MLGGVVMDYEAIMAKVLALLQQEKRVAYRVLKRRLQLDDDLLEDLKDDLIYAKRLAVDEEGKVLVWAGIDGLVTVPMPSPTQPVEPPDTATGRDLQAGVPPSARRTPEAERRQLTVLFCDLVDSTMLASQLDPEEWREVVRAYQAACAKVIARFEGHIAQYLGDGLLVYFGYPQAHENDAQRSVYAGLGIIDRIAQVNTHLVHERGIRLGLRIGIHTGLVVVGEIGAGSRTERLALGETPNLAARLQGLAAPDTVAISAATAHLIQGYFTCDDLGVHHLKGVTTPVRVYQVLDEISAQSRLDVAAGNGLTPLVGREQEVGVLLERWARVKDGMGQVVVLSGEAGIGKSRLIQALTAQMTGEPHRRWECRCSPYYQHSAFYPMIELLQQVLRVSPDDPPATKLHTLECTLALYRMALPEVVPLLAALLSIPLPDHYPPLALPPPRQKQKTLEALVAVLLALAEEQPLLLIMEDLHWVDPSTLELLTTLIDQTPIAHILTLLTYRPEFRPPWGFRAHLTPLTVSRLAPSHAEMMIEHVTKCKALPVEVVQQILAKTDGVPLFVEELTKMVLESGLLREEDDHFALIGPLPSLAIPATLHDSLMARLDRLATVKEVAQLGAILGRAFSYELLRAVSLWEEGMLQRALAQLVEAELLYQRGVSPHATYLFKHALIQEAAHASLLKRTRQQHHQRTAQVLEAQFPETRDSQPELLAHHYTEANLAAAAIPYWQQAGQRAIERSAYPEAIAHLTKGLEVLSTLPDGADRAQQELGLQTTLGPVYIATQGAASPAVECAYARARELCRLVGETPQLFPALWGLWVFYFVRGELPTGRELGQQLLSLAQHVQEPALLLEAHLALGAVVLRQGEVVSARAHLEQGIALYDPQRHRSHAFRYGQDPQVACCSDMAYALWCLGYPDQALRRSQEALTLARELSHPFSLAFAHVFAAWLHQHRREVQTAQQWAEAAISLATGQGFTLFLAQATILRGWALSAQGQGGEGMVHMRQGLDACRATGAELFRPYYLALLAEAAGQMGQPEEGLHVLGEALAAVDRGGEHFYEAELYRLQGELRRQQTGLGVEQTAAMGAPTAHEVEICFRKALDIARGQRAKSWELRAAVSLGRLWRQQGKRDEARELLAPIYGWFTEGFDTPDLQEAKALLEELS
jgi:TOMM system kinase/cyclase fusion protein